MPTTIYDNKHYSANMTVTFPDLDAFKVGEVRSIVVRLTEEDDLHIAQKVWQWDLPTDAAIIQDARWGSGLAFETDPLDGKGFWMEYYDWQKGTHAELRRLVAACEAPTLLASAQRR